MPAPLRLIKPGAMFRRYAQPGAIGDFHERASHPDPSDPARPAYPGGVRHQHHPDQGRNRQGPVGRGAEPVPAPRRPDPQSGRHREGLCGPGELGADRGVAGQSRRHAGQVRRQRHHRPSRLPEIPGRPEQPVPGPGPVPGAAGAVSGAEIQRQFHGPAEPAGGHRKPRDHRAARLQSGGPRLQHHAQNLPLDPLGQNRLRLVQAHATVRSRLDGPGCADGEF